MPQERDDEFQEAQGEAASEAAGPSEHAENERVKVRGRIGNKIIFRTTSEQGKPVANFSLAEHPNPADPEQTIWHNAAVFGERAEQLQRHVEEGEIKTGMEVDVVGFVHFRERPRREGGTQLFEQIYVVSIKPVVKAQDTPQSPETPPGPIGPQSV